MEEHLSTTCVAPSEPLLCAACFTLLGEQRFYDGAALDSLQLESVHPQEVQALCAAIESHATGVVELFEHYLTALRSKEQRHEQGMVFTPEPIVRAMVSDSMSERPGRVIDCGCGAGRFALCAAQMATSQSLSIEVLAFDADPLACLLTATAARITNCSVTVICDDFVQFDIQAVTKRTAYIGNPPYVRHHDLTKAQKDTGKRLADGLGLTGWSKLSGLHALFILKCIASSRQGDSIRFITGAEWLEVNYGRPLREAFASNVGGGARLTQFSPLSAVFENAQSTALISYWKPQSEGPGIAYDYISESASYPSVITPPLIISRDALLYQRKWSFAQLENDQRRNKRPESCSSNLIELGSLFRVSRGAATGKNTFFVLSRDEAARRDLEPYCVPVISKASDVPQDGSPINRSKLRKMLFAPNLETALAEDTVRGYIALGEALEVNQGHIASHRKPWWHVKCSSAPIVATYMGRGRPRFSLNPDGCPTLNTVHGLHPKRAFSQRQLELVVDYLNHGQLFGDNGRVYQGGLRKFEPREMERILIPPLESLEALARQKERPCAPEPLPIP